MKPGCPLLIFRTMLMGVLLLGAGLWSPWIGPFEMRTSAFAQTTDPVITDFATYLEPSPPALPRAGAKTVDPVFGTTILRLTDGSDGNSAAGVMYSYYPVFNKNNSRLVVVERFSYSRAKFFTFDPVTFTASNGFVLSSPPSGLQEYGMTWSGNDPDVIYGIGGHRIWAINVATKANILVKDLSSQGVGGYLTQMIKSLDDDVFAATIADSGGAAVGYVVYERSTDRVLKRALVTNMDEVHIDKSGRYLTVVYNDGHDEVFDLAPSPPTQIATLTQAAGTGFWHHDTGMGNAFTAYGGNALGFRQLSTPKTVTPLIRGYWSYSTQQDHFSMLADNEGWALSSRYSKTGGGVVNPFDNEIMQVATDGSNRVRRLAHHRSIVNSYDVQPKAAISRDGRFVAFTSNWGSAGGRRDVYIVQIPPAPGSTNSKPPEPPQNLKVQ